MKTYSPKKEDIQKNWYLVDAKGKTLGHMATTIANVLRGKNKPQFSPHMDCGDYVVVINAQEVHLSGNKLAQKKYYRHSSYPGGLKVQTAEDVRSKNPSKIVEKAITGMIPHNKLHKEIVKKLKVYPGTEHKHEAQNPQPLEL